MKGGSSGLMLASGSVTRRAMLEAAGLHVHSETPGVDEEQVKQSLRADGAQAHDVAETLAEMKALRVSRRHPGMHVLAADQMLVCGDVWFDKPADHSHLQGQLMALRGRTHHLIASAVIAIDGARIWHHTDRASLTMRAFSDAFLEAYIERVGDAVLSNVGGYQIEGHGIHLFERIEGSHFTIMGLPLLPVLAFLRDRGVVVP